MASEYIAIAGVMGSGKTTVAKGLARVLRWNYLPETARGLRFLPDLFKDQTRWALPAQISFLADKGKQIIELSEQNNMFVLDRSIYEDIQIFAEYFRDRGHIDGRSFETYQLLSEYFLSKISAPTILIYCDCPLKDVVDRIKQRAGNVGKAYSEAYPDGHVEEIFGRYGNWIHTYRKSPILRINTQSKDYRDIQNLRSLIDQMQVELSKVTPGSPQLALFSNTVMLGSPDESGRGALTAIRNSANAIYPRAYIAAPFTSRTTSSDSQSKSLVALELFDNSPPHGVIPRGTYRLALSRLARKVEMLGISVLLPHRDINRWGRKKLNEREVFASCTKEVVGCDLFIGLLGQSTGSHYEFGVASGLGKPSILIRCAEVTQSFIGEGVVSTSNVLLCECTTLKEIPSIMDRVEVRQFLSDRLSI